MMMPRCRYAPLRLTAVFDADAASASCAMRYAIIVAMPRAPDTRIDAMSRVA